MLLGSVYGIVHGLNAFGAFGKCFRRVFESGGTLFYPFSAISVHENPQKRASFEYYRAIMC